MQKRRFVLKRFLSLLLATVCAVGLFFPLTFGASAATKMTETTFRAKLKNYRETVYADGSTYKDNNKNSYGSQCFGYANYTAVRIFGSYPCADMSGVGVRSGWKITHGADAVDSLSAGDIVRYLYHSIFITDIIGDCVFFTDANQDGRNTVYWENNFFTKDNLRYLLSQPLSSGASSIDGKSYTGWVAHYKNWENAPTQAKKGDVNRDGAVDISDAMAVFYHIAKKEYLPFFHDELGVLCDTNGDNFIDISDAMQIFYFVANKIPSLE